MVYRNRKGYYNRRRGTYRRKGYSMYKLYKNRSGAAQARQIYGLNKKLKWIERKTRPEINIAPLVQGTILSTDGDTLTGVSSNVHVSGPISLTNLRTAEQSSQTSSVQIEGRLARLQNITLKGLFTYDVASTGSSSSPSYADLQRMVSFLRIVIIQTKSTRSSGAPNNSDIWSNDTQGSNTLSTSPALTQFACVRAPLQYGVARIAKVLSDKTYMISDTKQAVSIKTKLRYVKNWYKSITEDGPKGGVYMYVMMLNSNGQTTGNVSSSAFTYVSKCVYTDA